MNGNWAFFHGGKRTRNTDKLATYDPPMTGSEVELIFQFPSVAFSADWLDYFRYAQHCVFAKRKAKDELRRPNQFSGRR
jgi:hypothetical protein